MLLNTYRIRIGRRKITAELHQKVDNQSIIHTLWQFYESAFPSADNGWHDFSQEELFGELIGSEDVFTLFALDEYRRPSSYLVFSSERTSVLRWGMKDTMSIQAHAGGKKVYWVFLFVPKNHHEAMGPETKTTFLAAAEFFHRQGAAFAFDQRPETHLSTHIAKVLTKHGGEGFKVNFETIATIETVLNTFTDSP